jgi:hypothetical protein
MIRVATVVLETLVKKVSTDEFPAMKLRGFTGQNASPELDNQGNSNA